MGIPFRLDGLRAYWPQLHFVSHFHVILFSIYHQLTMLQDVENMIVTCKMDNVYQGLKSLNQYQYWLLIYAFTVLELSNNERIEMAILDTLAKYQQY